jgi:hypothetical protein
MSSYAANERITIMITTGAKTRVTGFHCRQLQKDAYKALKAFMALTGATTEEALQTFIQFAAWGWQSPTHRKHLTEMVQKWKGQRPKDDMTLHTFALD